MSEQSELAASLTQQEPGLYKEHAVSAEVVDLVKQGRATAIATKVADVDGPGEVGLQQREQAGDEVVDIADAAGLRAVAGDGDRFACGDPEAVAQPGSGEAGLSSTITSSA